jgi:hypothetical protein
MMDAHGPKGSPRAFESQVDGGGGPAQAGALRWYYLAGYAVECAIKACIAKATQRCEFPDKKKVESSYSHNFRGLIKVAGLEEARLEQLGKDPEFQRNWEVVQTWSGQSRYRRHRPESAQALLGAVGDRRHGVISWI